MVLAEQISQMIDIIQTRKTTEARRMVATFDPLAWDRFLALDRVQEHLVDAESAARRCGGEGVAYPPMVAVAERDAV